MQVMITQGHQEGCEEAEVGAAVGCRRGRVGISGSEEKERFLPSYGQQQGIKGAGCLVGTRAAQGHEV